jgi:hypothetical protein
VHLFTLIDTHTHTHIVGITPLDEKSARRRDPYLTTNNTHKRQASMPQVGFKTAIPAIERPLFHPLDRVATEIGRPISGKHFE